MLDLDLVEHLRLGWCVCWLPTAAVAAQAYPSLPHTLPWHPVTCENVCVQSGNSPAQPGIDCKLLEFADWPMPMSAHLYDSRRCRACCGLHTVTIGGTLISSLQ
jgi:hypothetical protein